MQFLVTSPEVLAPNGKPDAAVVSALSDLAGDDVAIGVLSNHPKPDWFDGLFPKEADVEFVHETGRQDGTLLKNVADRYKVQPWDILVLGAKVEDLAMAKNAGALFVAAGWSGTNPSRYGIEVSTPSELAEVVALVREWPGGWYFQGDGDGYRVNVLADVSSNYTSSMDQAAFGQRCVATVKHGGPKLTALLCVLARSMLKSNIGTGKTAFFGVYPSSSSTNADDEVLSDFTHRLRSLTCRVQMAKPGEPLFLRHKPSTKRSSAGSSNRTDPSEQVQTLHVNPAYRGKLRGRNVVVIDDCATYGVSFGVAAALLRAAGAASITGIAIGKFGDRLERYKIDLKKADVYVPIKARSFTFNHAKMPGTVDSGAQQVLRKLL